MELLIVVDMQKDFIDGTLGTKEAQSIIEPVIEEIKNFTGNIVFTMDTHDNQYLTTQEGSKLPVVHCVKGSEGWHLEDRIDALAKETKAKIFEKPGFGSMELAQYVKRLYQEEGLTRVLLIGLCTDICVISNAMLLKAAAPELIVEVKESCCAGVTKESHSNALRAMEMCHISIV